MGKKGKQFISVLMILALLLGIFPTNVVWAAEQSDDVEKILENPKVKSNSQMESGREVTWDCVWFWKLSAKRSNSRVFSRAVYLGKYVV